MPPLKERQSAGDNDFETDAEDGLANESDLVDMDAPTKCRLCNCSTWPRRLRMQCFCIGISLVLVVVVIVLAGTKGAELQNVWAPAINPSQPSYNLPDAIRDSVDAIRQDLDRLIDYSVKGEGKGTAWLRAAHICDKFGHRQVGGQGLEDAIDEMEKIFKEDSLQNVRFETLEVPKWVRGEEAATLLEPLAGGKTRPLSMLGLGMSTGTEQGGLEAEVLVVRDVEELAANADLANGRIVVFSFPFTSYGSTRPYRSHGPSFAAKLGAVAAGISSLASFSLSSPHTGSTSYRKGTLTAENSASWGGGDLPEVFLGDYTDVPHIPGFALSQEDAYMLERLYRSGAELRMRLEMEARLDGTAETRNVLAEIEGSEKPDEDDLAACMVMSKVIATIKALGLQPRRTIRVVLFTAEEIGSIGGFHHLQVHPEYGEKLSAIFDLDSGIFHWLGMAVTADDLTVEVMRYISTSLKRIGADRVGPDRWRATSNLFMAPPEIPVIGSPIQMPINAIRPDYFEGGAQTQPTLFQGNYWLYHHTHADRMETLEPAQMDRAVAVASVYTYALAMLPDRLTRGPNALGDFGGEGLCDTQATRELPVFVTCSAASSDADTTGTQLTAWVMGAEPS